MKILNIECNLTGDKGIGFGNFEVKNIGTENLIFYGCGITGGGGNIYDFTLSNPDGGEKNNNDVMAGDHIIIKPGKTSFANFKIQTWDSDHDLTPNIIESGGSFPIINVYSDDLSGTTHTLIDDYIGDIGLESKWDITISWTLKS